MNSSYFLKMYIRHPHGKLTETYKSNDKLKNMKHMHCDYRMCMIFNLLQ